MLVLLPDRQSHGYGSEVVEGVLSKLSTNPDLSTIGLNVYAENPKGLRFWHLCGFNDLIGVDLEQHLDRTYTCITLQRPIRNRGDLCEHQL